MPVYTKTANDVFAPTDSGGDPRKVSNAEAQTWGTEVEGEITALRDILGGVTGKQEWYGLFFGDSIEEGKEPGDTGDDNLEAWNTDEKALVYNPNTGADVLASLTSGPMNRGDGSDSLPFRTVRAMAEAGLTVHCVDQSFGGSTFEDFLSGGSHYETLVTVTDAAIARWGITFLDFVHFSLGANNKSILGGYSFNSVVNYGRQLFAMLRAKGWIGPQTKVFALKVMEGGNDASHMNAALDYLATVEPQLQVMSANGLVGDLAEPDWIHPNSKSTVEAGRRAALGVISAPAAVFSSQETLFIPNNIVMHVGPDTEYPTLDHFQKMLTRLSLSPRATLGVCLARAADDHIIYESNSYYLSHPQESQIFYFCEGYEDYDMASLASDFDETDPDDFETAVQAIFGCTVQSGNGGIALIGGGHWGGVYLASTKATATGPVISASQQSFLATRPGAFLALRQCVVSGRGNGLCVDVNGPGGYADIRTSVLAHAARGWRANNGSLVNAGDGGNVTLTSYLDGTAADAVLGKTTYVKITARLGEATGAGRFEARDADVYQDNGTATWNTTGNNQLTINNGDVTATSRVTSAQSSSGVFGTT